LQSRKAGLDLRTVWWRRGSELTNGSYDLLSSSESTSITSLNIPTVNWGREEGAEGEGRKRSRKSCTRIGPTKEGLISSPRCDIMTSDSSQLSVVELLVYTDVVVACDRTDEGFAGGVVGMDGNKYCPIWVVEL
jgi:hypothetical protein